MSVTEADRTHLKRCVALAAEALTTGDAPYGSVLVSSDGKVLFEDRNRVFSGGDGTHHPEFTIAQWASTHLSPEERAASTVYTSGEHCAMCSAAHAWCGLGKIVFATSSAQVLEWNNAWGCAPPAITQLPISAVAPNVPTVGPVEEFVADVKGLQAKFAGVA